HARAEAELDPGAAPTRESKDVVYALAAHEISIARQRQSAEPAMVELSELDLELEPDPALDLDFEDSLPTRVKTPAPVLTWLQQGRLQIIERERVATPPPVKATINWRMLLLCAEAIVAAGLAVLVYTRVFQ
ncbi:MAG TPA: hypothetical protein VN914_18590, partial [Polyangia bacterium]|nr:hypothetical protein [Polyangia bacterium]